jgi:hypothetical protein
MVGLYQQDRRCSKTSMIVHTPELRTDSDRLVLEAEIEIEAEVAGFPRTLWFEILGDQTQRIGLDGMSFAVCLLPLAMQLGEDMEVRGAVSPRLLQGMMELQKVFQAWWPGRAKVVSIEFDEYLSPSQDSGTGVACAFSGGVDSFYTLYTHLPRQECIPGFHVDRVLFVHGFDIPLEATDTFEICRNAYAELMERLGVTLVCIRTNLRHFRIDWEMGFGCALIGTALIFHQDIKRFLVASESNSVRRLPRGSSPVTDHLLSTEWFEVWHDSATVGRLEKTRVIANWPETYRLLRVCWRKPHGLENCCECDKCVRTMVTLDLLGALGRYKTFPRQLTRRHVRRLRLNAVEISFIEEIVQYAKSVGAKEYALDLRVALARNRALQALNPWRRKFSSALRRVKRVVAGRL